VVQAAVQAGVTSGVSGRLVEILAEPGQEVSAGQALVRLTNEELVFGLREVVAQIGRVRALRRQALSDELANLDPLDRHLATLASRRRRVEEDLERLTVRAPESGVWSAPRVRELAGLWIPRGAALGIVLGGDEKVFASVIRQEDSDRLFSGRIVGAEVRLHGRGDESLRVSSVNVLPAETHELPSSALGWGGGGEVAVDVADRSGRTSARPLFQARAHLAERGAPLLRYGRTGVLRFELPPEPIVRQWLRKLRQMLQRRYGL
jgi:hypothetical protein